MSYTLSPTKYAELKRQLKAAVRSNSASAVRAAHRGAFTVFNVEGYPDDWHDWQRAVDDVELDQTYGIGLWNK